MVLFVERAQLVLPAGKSKFERLLLGGNVGVDETVGGNCEWLIVGVYLEPHHGDSTERWVTISLVSPSSLFAMVTK